MFSTYLCISSHQKRYFTLNMFTCSHNLVIKHFPSPFLIIYNHTIQSSQSKIPYNTLSLSLALAFVFKKEIHGMRGTKFLRLRIALCNTTTTIFFFLLLLLLLLLLSNGQFYKCFTSHFYVLIIILFSLSSFRLHGRSCKMM